MLDEDYESNVSWIGFSDLFFHLFIFFLIAFASVKIAAVAKIDEGQSIIKRLETQVSQLEAQVKLLEAQLDTCLLKAAKCKNKTTETVEEKDKLLQQIEILSLQLQTCQEHLENCKKSLTQCNYDLNQCRIKLKKYDYLEKYLVDNSIGPDITQIEQHKSELITQIVTYYYSGEHVVSETDIKRCAGDIVSISDNDSLCLENTTLQEQTISFGSSILFPVQGLQLMAQGQEVLRTIGIVIKEKLDAIQEIQIQGHADITGTQEYNLALASGRAASVFLFFKNEVGIDPAKVMMSATSFGNYKPVNRMAAVEYDWEKIQADNDTEEKKERNRRIEIVLTYRR
ncbi:MAG: OmpA family protein [Thiomargarita sp.]|nr:OmpA family protein [Thiomargarita sp.]